MVKRILFRRSGLVRSMVLQVYQNGPGVPRFLLSTFVLRIWAWQAIGRGDREWETPNVKRPALSVADAARLSGILKICTNRRNALLWR
jgi:hypothetical protein